jgi:signal peptide peptidase SppA
MLIQLADFLCQPLMMDVTYRSYLTKLATGGDLSSIKPVQHDLKMAAERQASAASKSGARITAVLPVHGIIDARDSWMLQMFGGTALDSLMEAVDICMNEPRVGGIVFDFNTPGGSACGVKVAADMIAKCRADKPMVSCVRYQMASAGYYLGSATSRIIAEPGSTAGSIGVLIEHQEESKMLDKMGITTTILRVPEYKAEGISSEPLSEAAKTAMMGRISQIYDDFTADVARYRGVTQASVQASYGQGRVLSARDALAAGMVDKIGTFNEIIDQMSSGTMARSLAQTGRMTGEIDTAVLRNKMNAAML